MHELLKKFFRAADWPGIVDLARELSVRDDPADVSGLQTALGDPVEAYKAGTRCRCGEPIWVPGSADRERLLHIHHGRIDPSQDYELAEACHRGGVRSGGEHGIREAARGKVQGPQ
jgi:hypothetical protein